MFLWSPPHQALCGSGVTSALFCGVRANWEFNKCLPCFLVSLRTGSEISRTVISVTSAVKWRCRAPKGTKSSFTHFYPAAPRSVQWGTSWVWGVGRAQALQVSDSEQDGLWAPALGESSVSQQGWGCRQLCGLGLFPSCHPQHDFARKLQSVPPNRDTIKELQ